MTHTAAPPAPWSLALPRSLFYVTLLALVLLKLALVADLLPLVVFAPHDDRLYVMRALSLLNGEGLGPYDSWALVKLPGLSIWLAALRSLSLPYLPALHLLYVAAGIYMLAALRRAGAGLATLTVVFALYLFNPVTLSVEWFRVIREPLSTVLLVALAASMLHLLVSFRRTERYAHHLLLLTTVFAFAMLVREEDRLLWVLLALFGAALWYIRRQGGGGTRLRLAALLVIPALAAVSTNTIMREAVDRWYGAPILHDIGEGEYPRLLAAIRSIKSAKDNRLVMVTQEALAKLRVAVPEFAPVVERLSPPGPATLSCKLQGVCTEWSNGWMPFWIKDAAFEAGLTPTLPAAQQYFRLVRERIEAACAARRLECHDRGAGALPPFELRWTRAYVHEFIRLLKMTIAPGLSVITEPQSLSNVSPGLTRIFQTVTMAHYDPVSQGSAANAVEPVFTNRLAHWRPWISASFNLLNSVFLFCAALALILIWINVSAVSAGPAVLMATAFYLFMLFRLAVLSYLATFFGPFEPRLIFATDVVALLFAPILVREALHVLSTRTTTAAVAR